MSTRRSAAIGGGVAAWGRRGGAACWLTRWGGVRYSSAGEPRNVHGSLQFQPTESSSISAKLARRTGSTSAVYTSSRAETPSHQSTKGCVGSRMPAGTACFSPVSISRAIDDTPSFSDRFISSALAST
eukprot:scaffold53887_cov57-Phaeocystis_antarctica.AAC.5